VNFRIETRYDARGQQGRHGKEVVGIATELIDPKDAAAFGIDQFHRNEISLAVAPQIAGRYILRIHQGGGRRGGQAAQRKSRTSGNDAEASQFGKAEDDVAGDAVGVRNGFLAPP
jgi:hypothetical protein